MITPLRLAAFVIGAAVSWSTTIAAVGRLLAALDRLGLDDNTLVFFSSDNGPETLDRYPDAKRSYGSPGPLRGMKLWTPEAGSRVAGILRWPGRVPAGRQLDGGDLPSVANVTETTAARGRKARLTDHSAYRLTDDHGWADLGANGVNPEIAAPAGLENH